MPIQCRTGCKEQVNYEHFPFPDGFVYCLPKNLDDTIHDCKNLRITSRLHRVNLIGDDGTVVEKIEVPIHSWSPEEKHFQDIQDNNGISGVNGIEKLTDEEWKKLFHTSPNQYNFEYNELAYSSKKLVNEQVNKSLKSADKNSLHKLLLNAQMRCILFPTPFLSNNDNANEGISDLIYLSNLYEQLGDLESAVTSRLIQNNITQDQTVKILELVKKQKKSTGTTDEEILELNLSVQELRNNYFRKVENMIKSFIRKKYTKRDYLKKDFPILYQKANKLRGNTSKHVEHTNEDVVEFLSFGQCVNILKTNLKDRKKEEWHIIDWDIINHAFYVVDRRNDIDHYSGGNLEESIPKESKTLGYVFSKEIIEFFENLNHV
jgi:hypothetical protein